MAFFFLRKKSLGQRDALVVENVRAIVGGSHLICLISQWPGGAVMWTLVYHGLPSGYLT